MRAVLVDPTAPERLVLREVDPPRPLPHEAIVRVAAFSVNRGEVRRSQSAEAGWRPGWDLAGTIEQAAADGSGPPVGTRVVGLLNAGAWAERVAVATDFLAALPESVSFEQAATLPVAGLTAYHALALGGMLLGKRVLITGASGGVGHFAIQLAKLAGAFVVGALRRDTHAQLVRDAGADALAIGEDLAESARTWAPYDVVLDSVGGATLGAALAMLAKDATCVNFGPTGGTQVTFDVAHFYSQSPGARLIGFYLFHQLRREPAAIGLARLASLVAVGRLKPDVAVQAPWEEVARVARDLTERRFEGKAVLTL